ncbi:protease complex subunit PrcB family protein [Brassicibacter mesophilus]|uniref:protease complex subunit PrcB family protein n=1 Tax=Brassicibacter mesophilus TaxID=745119 RepID=UPI003D21F942
MKNFKAIALVLAVIMATFVFSACSPNKKTEPQMGNLTFEAVDTNSIDDNKVKQWYEKNWQSKGVFSFDSDEDKYILISAGQKPTGGYDVDIVSIEGKEDKIVVNAKVNTPKEGQMVTEILTYPNILVKIQKDERDVALGDFENPTIEENKNSIQEQTEKTGVYVGLMDSNSCEIMVDGVANAFRLSEDVKAVINDIKANDKVQFSYYENEYEQLVLTQIEKANNTN